MVFIPHDCIFYRLTEKQKKTTLWKQKPSTGECLHQCCFELSRISSSVSILLKDRSEREMFSISVKKIPTKTAACGFGHILVLSNVMTTVTDGWTQDSQTKLMMSDLDATFLQEKCITDNIDL